VTGPVEAIGALVEPNRRLLYEYVVDRRDWVGRDEAATAVGIGRGITAHHLDRLADDGLLEVDYRRLNDRSGPGAGRPAKVYRRAPSEVAVSLPPRHYDIAARLLAEAAERSRRDGTPIEHAIELAAREEGRAIAADAELALDRRAGIGARRARVLEELRARGFEPEVQRDGVVVLHNCPFHQLSQTHTELICGMNLCLLDSLLGEFPDLGWRAALEPAQNFCCVRFHPDSRARERAIQGPVS
jgi:predicted ArsR family transcriptional regulator